METYMSTNSGPNYIDMIFTGPHDDAMSEIRLNGNYGLEVGDICDCEPDQHNR